MATRHLGGVLALLPWKRGVLAVGVHWGGELALLRTRGEELWAVTDGGRRLSLVTAGHWGRHGAVLAG